MSFIIRNLWRGVTRASCVHRSVLLHSRHLSATNYLNGYQPVVTGAHTALSKSQDPIMSSLTSAPTASELFATLQSQQPSLNQKHLVQALRTLFEFHKKDLVQKDIIKDPAFEFLCQNIKKQSKLLEINDIIEVIKVVSYLGVPVNSLIVQTMLQLIRSQINELNIRQIMFIDFILSKFDVNNHLVDALKLALPLVFQIHLPLELDREDLPLLKDMLSYSCYHDLPDKCVNNVVTALLVNEEGFDAQTAKSIIWSLCQVNCTKEVFPTRAKLLSMCFEVLSEKILELPYGDVLWTMAKLKSRILEKHPEYYNEALMDAVGDFVVKKNVSFEHSLLIARILSRIYWKVLHRITSASLEVGKTLGTQGKSDQLEGYRRVEPLPNPCSITISKKTKLAHSHLGLMEHLCNQAYSDPTCLATVRPNMLLGFINCLSNANYIPHQEKWTVLRKQISENPLMDSDNTAMPWCKLCLELASLGHYEDRLLEKVYSDQFLQQILDKSAGSLDCIQLLMLHNAVQTFHNPRATLPLEVVSAGRAAFPVHTVTDPVADSLARGLPSPDCLVTNVILNNGLIADILMCIQYGQPVKLPQYPKPKLGKVPLTKLDIPRDSITVCIMCFTQNCYSLNSSRLRGTFQLLLQIIERQGYIAVPINVSQWLATPSRERTPFIMREISYKCGSLAVEIVKRTVQD